MRRWLFLLLLIIGSVSLQAENFDHQHRSWNDLLEGAVHWQRNQAARTADYQGVADKTATVGRLSGTIVHGAPRTI